jgi:hypothetical protein
LTNMIVGRVFISQIARARDLWLLMILRDETGCSKLKSSGKNKFVR